jgi:hypothetical protein
MSTTTDAATLADTIRFAAPAWWSLAADRLEGGQLEDAETFARLGRFGTEDAVQRIEAVRSVQAT